MRLESAVEYVELSLTVALVVRLFTLRLGKVYTIFAAFLLSDLVSSIAASFYDFHLLPVDYRVFYLCTRVVAWALSLWVVYALLDAMLKNLPGILKYSRRFLHVIFAVSALVSLLALNIQNAATKVARWKSTLDRLVTVTYVIDQTIGITVLLVLLGMLAFFLWFPVKVPRNLAIFSVGYVVYFAAITASLALQNLENAGASPINSIIPMLVTSVCYAYWTIFLSRAGENVPVRVGHGWKLEEQQRLIGRLEEVNGVLMQALANKKAV